MQTKNRQQRCLWSKIALTSLSVDVANKSLDLEDNLGTMKRET